VRIGLYIASEGDIGLDEVIDGFLTAEARGFHTAWVGHTFGWDALSLLALAGRATRRIELGSWVVPTYPRHPVALAQQALTVQQACGGRLALGIGVSHAAVVEKRMGIDHSHPLRHMREVLAVLPALLAGEGVGHRGEEFRIEARLETFGVSPPPILIAALGPRMLELAGRLADGVAIWLGDAPFVRDFAIPHLDAGARAVGRPRPRVVVGLPVALTRDDGALEAVARYLGPSAKLPAYRRVLERGGADGPGSVALVGDEAALRRRLEALAEIGVTDFHAILVPVRGDPGVGDRTRDFLADFAGSGI